MGMEAIGEKRGVIREREGEEWRMGVVVVQKFRKGSGIESDNQPEELAVPRTGKEGYLVPPVRNT